MKKTFKFAIILAALLGGASVVFAIKDSAAPQEKVAIKAKLRPSIEKACLYADNDLEKVADTLRQNEEIIVVDPDFADEAHSPLMVRYKSSKNKAECVYYVERKNIFWSKGDAQPTQPAAQKDEPQQKASVAALPDTTQQESDAASFPCPMKSITVGKKTFNVADINDVAKVYKETVNKAQCFFVISKQEFRLYVYEVAGNDTTLVAHYPVCYAKFKEGKTRQGDMRTPDCSLNAPFRISQICDASTWRHDFKDGRGNIKAYGDWFIRLDLSKSNVPAAIKGNRSIGIHGSSGNKESVPGMDSEGCIRLRDADIRDLKARFAQVGTKVVVLPYTQGKLSFMKKAEQRLGNTYQYAKKGYMSY